MTIVARIDIGDFRAAAEAVRKINGDNTDLDLSPVNKVTDILANLTKPGLEGFLKLDAATRCLLRGGGDRLGKKITDDSKLYHLVRSEILGNARRICTIDETRRKRTERFFAGVACID